MALQKWAEDLVEQAVGGGASYADVRVVDRSSEFVQLWDGKIEQLLEHRDRGFGIRVIVDGAWGFAGSSDFSHSVDIIRRALEVARASSVVQHSQVELASISAMKQSWKTPIQIDPRRISFSERIDLLQAADSEMASVQGVTQRKASMGFYFTNQLFTSSEGAEIEQEIVECGAGIVALAAGMNEVQHRSFPASFQGDYGTAGYEYVLGIGLVEGAKQCGEEAVALLSAKECSPGRTTVILDSSMLTLQVHESIGHALELDRVLGSEASFAGTSFATPEKLGNFCYGSPHVTISADATLPHGLASFGFDDEGAPARRTVLIDKGILVNYLTSRETSARLGGLLAPGKNTRSVPISGNMRADGWQRTPLVRMTNINLEPGDSSLAKMIAGTDEGLVMKTVNTYSIDDKRLNFTFSPEIAWEIKNGRLGAMVKNARYSGMTPEFWNSCDAVAGMDEWHLWGIPACGKGEPGQSVHVGHGTAPARFRNVKVGG
jgi:TldD protein